MAEGAGERYDFFISRAGSDREAADRIAHVLEDAGHSVLFQDWD